MEFQIQSITEHITRIQSPCTEYIYLVTGDDRAALIDTGSGIGSLKSVTDTLTELPVTVLITHGHVDHAMGAAEFDDVYMNHEDKYIFDEHGQDDFRLEGVMHSQLANDFRKERDYIETADFSKFKPLKEGDIFDLGGRTVEVYACPGHTKGSLVMLLPEDRILITGDAANDATFLFEHYSTTISEYQESLKRLLPKVKGKYDRILTCHHKGEVPRDTIEGLISLCDDIKDGKTDDMPLPFPVKEEGYFAKAIEGPSMERLDGGVGNIVYRKGNVMPPG